MTEQLYFFSWRDVPAEVWRWPDFRPFEIRCGIGRPDHPDAGRVCLVPQAMQALQVLRSALGHPVVITSAFRTPAYNRGAENSLHTAGLAFDIADSPHYSQDELIAAARDVGFRGIGHYETFTHIDLGPARDWYTPG